MLSVMTVVSMPSRTSSHAVSRAPWRNGRVSSANTATFFPCSTARANHAERRAVAGRRERARVAVREDARVRRARPPRRCRPSRGSSRRPRRGCCCASRSSARLICSTDSPACDACGERRASSDRSPRTDSPPSAACRPSGRRSSGTRRRTAACPSPCSSHAERDAHRRGDADRRRAADHHRLDGPGDLLRGLAADVDLLRPAACADRPSRRRQLPLDRRKHHMIIPDKLKTSLGALLFRHDSPAHLALPDSGGRSCSAK